MAETKFYYIDTIEQVKAKEESEFNVNEYGKREVCKNQDGTPMIYNEAYSKYCEKKKNVSSDLIEDDPENNHYYMDIKIVDSDGGVLEKHKFGTRQEFVKKEQPEPEPTPEPEETN